MDQRRRNQNYFNFAATFTQSGKDLVEKYSSAPYFQLVLNVTDCNCNWSKKYMQ